MIKRSIQGEDVTIVDMYAANIGSPKYIRELTALKGEISNNISYPETLTPHLQQWTDHPDRKSIRKHRP